ncbi:MAG TPA: glycosyltransferase [Paraburkholderia sp.]|nr:glycosyltransferase [Paraburkholderia sp.]
MIPKLLHFIWIGDESKRPDNCIATWRKLNPDLQIRVWGNNDLLAHRWPNARQMQEMWPVELNGVADLMRWQFLYWYGGFSVDADSICVRKLDPELFECDLFTCWENEVVVPGLMAAGYVGARPGHPLFKKMVDDIGKLRTVCNDKAWKTVGPLRFTQAIHEHKPADLTVFPSHYFIPRHHSGRTYSGSGRVYAKQLWGSTFQSYESIHTLEFN